MPTPLRPLTHVEFLRALQEGHLRVRGSLFRLPLAFYALACAGLVPSKRVLAHIAQSVLILLVIPLGRFASRSYGLSWGLLLWLTLPCLLRALYRHAFAHVLVRAWHDPLFHQELILHGVLRILPTAPEVPSSPPSPPTPCTGDTRR